MEQGVHELKDLLETEAHLSSVRPDELQNLAVNEIPILHYLARLPVKTEDCIKLDKIIKRLTSSGYDINQATDRYLAKKRVSRGFTALLAAVEQSNLHLVDYLIRNGARTEIRDGRGLSPLHWAVIVGDLKVVDKLVTSGAQLTSTEEDLRGEGDVHPILHTAVDEGRGDIVFYFLEKQVDANEEAIYRGVLSEASHIQFPSRYNNGQATLETLNMEFTPLGRAVRMRRIPIIEILLKQNAVNLSGFNELHFSIVEGDTEVACMLKDYFSDEELANDKINGKWALHCFHPSAFQDIHRVEKTKELIRHYVKAGWDINSMSESCYTLIHPLYPNYVGRSTQETTPMMATLDFMGYNLLHLACFSNGHEVVKFLVEEGADVNMRTKDKLDYTPLQLLILLEQWKSAQYLVEHGADLDVISGLSLASPMEFLGIMRSEGTLPGPSIGCTATQLLLRLGRRSGMPLLNQMLQKGILVSLPSEFHLAVEGANPEYVEEIILTEYESNEIALLDITWMPDLKFVEKNQLYVIPVAVPTLLCLLVSVLQKEAATAADVPILANIMKLMVSHGYDCNLVSSIKKEDVSKWEFGNTIWTCCELLRVPLVFSVLKIDFQHENNQLLKTLLDVDHVKLNVRDGKGMNPVEFVIDLWHQKCMSGHLCFRNTTTSCWETVRLLVTHGVDVSGMVIGENFKYHHGYLPVIQLLCSVGAQLDQSFFESPICHANYLGTESFPGEIEKLKEWKQNYDKNKLNLQLISRLTIRKMCKKIGDLNVVTSEVPNDVKYGILGKIVYFKDDGSLFK